MFADPDTATTLEASVFPSLITDWMVTISQQPQQNPPMFVTMIYTKTASFLPEIFCLLRALFRWPFSPYLLHWAVSFILAILGKFSMDLTHKIVFLSWVPSWIQLSLLVQLNHFVPPISMPWSHKNIAAFSATLGSLSPGEIFLYSNFFYFIGRPLGTKASKRGSETASLLLVVLWTAPVLWWRSCPNPKNPKTAVLLAVLS